MYEATCPSCLRKIRFAESQPSLDETSRCANCNQLFRLAEKDLQPVPPVLIKHKERQRISGIEAWGWIFIAIGGFLSFYFAFISPSSTPSSNSVNLDLLNRSLRGVIFGGVVTLTGIAFLVRK